MRDLLCPPRAAGLLILSLLAVLAAGSVLAEVAPAAGHRVVVFVWDGLRPDSISSEDTPTLAVFRARGVDFASHHSVYPTLTMTNAAALATGDYPERHGFYGNTIWAPEASGRNSQGRTVDFRQPVFTEEFGIIDSLDASAHGCLLATPTLIEQATAAGLRAAVIGKSGPVYLQDRTRRGLIVDEKAVFPFELARSLAAAGFALPALTGDAYPAGSPALPLHATAPRSGVVARLADDRTPDPSLGVVSPYAPVNEYLMRVLLDYLLPQRSPDLTIIWLRDPDTTEHAYGPGSTAYRDALRDMDRHFAELLDRLDSLHWRESTDVLVLSDHGHSTVSGDLTRYPLHGLHDRQIGGIDANGYSVSGAVRTADILAHAGVLAFDGFGVLCMAAPMDAPAAAAPSAVNAGIVANTPCRAPTNRLSVAHRVPGDWPTGQHPVVVAPDGGSEYFYLPDHDPATVRRLVAALQNGVEYGPIFVDARRYGDLPGTLRLSDVHLGSELPTQPDVVVSFAFDASAVVQGLPGIEYSSAYESINRGMHGSLSPRDVHNVLIAAGPSFRQHWVSQVPSSNVDIAPTVAALLHLPVAPMQGRVLREALRGAGPPPQITHRTVRSRIPARIEAGPDRPTTRLQSRLDIVSVRIDGRRYEYIDSGTLERFPTASRAH